jgi:hypothetical protein
MFFLCFHYLKNKSFLGQIITMLQHHQHYNTSYTASLAQRNLWFQHFYTASLAQRNLWFHPPYNTPSLAQRNLWFQIFFITLPNP